jgi:predicted 3-demethylubiquinone-9 3-methyltransferase (glyoxalase superfamily)
VSWQLILSDPSREPRPAIMPSLMFTGGVCGKAKEAGAFYRSVFDGSREGEIARYPAGRAPDREGTLMYSDFRLGDTWFAAMDSAHAHGFGFNEAISFVVPCRDQAEIDRHWARLSSVPAAEQCGWCKDRFGLSWQVTPIALEEVMASGDEATIARVTRAFLTMHKLDAATIEAAAARKD